MSRIRTLEFLPSIFQTPTNRQFLGATLDQLVNPPVTTTIQGFIGSKLGYGINANDYYVSEPTKERTDYQLEPGVVLLKENESVAKDFISYPGIINSLKLQNGITDNNNNLFNSQIYSFDSFCSLDNVINYNQYYWIPDGLPAVRVAASTVYNSNDYKVTYTPSAYNIQIVGSNTNVDNPIITLLRGGTYNFLVNQDTQFWIQGTPGITGYSPTQSNLYTRDIYGVSNNGENVGIVTFTVPAKTAQDDYVFSGNIPVDVVSTLPFNQINGARVSKLGGIDGVTSLNGRTVMFYNTGVLNELGYISNFYDETNWDVNDPALVADKTINVTATDNTGVITVSDTSSLTVNGAITFTGTGFGGLQPYDTNVGPNPVIYYIHSIVGYNTIKISETLGGPVFVTTASTGSMLGNINQGLYEEGYYTTVNQTFYTIEYVGEVTDPVIKLIPYGTIPLHQNIIPQYGVKYISLKFVKRFVATDIELLPYISAPLDTLYYQDGTNPNNVGKIKLIENNVNNTIDVETDILGHSTYTSKNGVVFTNGLKVEFDGDVVPTSYLQGQYYVEGVGTTVEDGGGIQLIPVESLSVPEPFASQTTAPYDILGWDTEPYDDALNIPLDQDYITIARNSINKNAWARSNRWFHIQVIEATAKYNDNSDILTTYATADNKAKRPIIQFYPNLKLFNSGTIGKTGVDFIDFRTTNAFNFVENQQNYYPDVQTYTTYTGTVNQNTILLTSSIIVGQWYEIVTLGITGETTRADVWVNLGAELNSDGLFFPSTNYVITDLGTNTDWNAIAGTANTLSSDITVGLSYQITTVGTTDFTLIGASSNSVGVIFTATGLGTGTGTVNKVYAVGDFFTAVNEGSATGTGTALKTLFKSTAVGIIPSNQLIAGLSYTIVELGTTQWHNIGASSTPTVGEIFVATRPAVGTGNAVQGTGAVKNKSVTTIEIDVDQVTGTLEVGQWVNDLILGEQSRLPTGTRILGIEETDNRYTITVYYPYPTDIVGTNGSVTALNSGTVPTGYTSGVFFNQPTTGGHGTGLTVDYVCSSRDKFISNVVINNPGTGYKDGDVIHLTGFSNILLNADDQPSGSLNIVPFIGNIVSPPVPTVFRSPTLIKPNNFIVGQRERISNISGNPAFYFEGVVTEVTDYTFTVAVDYGTVSLTGFIPPQTLNNLHVNLGNASFTLSDPNVNASFVASTEDNTNLLLFPGCRIVFANEADASIKNKIYTVEFNSTGSTSYPVITLTEAQDNPTLENEQFSINYGFNNKGTSFYFNNNEYVQAQQKQTINQSPLFDIFDSNGVSLGDTSVYNSSTFKGTPLFKYKVGTGLNDSVLGFPLTYSSFATINDIIFEISLYTDQFNYVLNSTSITEYISDGFVYDYLTRIDYKRLLGWQTSIAPSQQYQVFQFKYYANETPLVLEAGQTINFTVTCDVPQISSVPYYYAGQKTDISSSGAEWATLQVFNNNNLLVNGTDYTVENTTTSTVINILLTEDIDTPIEVLILSNQVSETAYYSIPINLSNNPFNTNPVSMNLGDIRGQYTSIFNNNPNMIGTMFGSNNYRDLGNMVPYGNRIIQNSASLVLPGAFLRDPETNIFDALLFNSREYIKFKSLLVYTANTIANNQTYNPSTLLDQAMDQITSVKNQEQPFFWSDMLPNKAAYITNTYSFANGLDTSIFPLSHTYDFTTANYDGVLVYLQRTIQGVVVTKQLTIGIDYTVSTTNPSLTVTTDLVTGDKIIVKEYNKTYGSYVPNTPTKLGLYPASIPKVIYDESYVTPTWFIVGHDGSLNTMYGEYNEVLGIPVDFRDQVLLEFETRVYNNLKLSRSIPIIPEAIEPGYFRDVTKGITNLNSGTIPTGYANGTFINKPTSGGTGTGLTVDYVCLGVDQPLIDVVINSLGTGYVDGDVISINGGNASFTLRTGLTPSTLTYAQFTEVYSTNFLNWVGQNRIDYKTQVYNPNNPWTYNYRGSTFTIGSNTGNVNDISYILQGNWRGIYTYLYDTPTPNTTPWEMIGYTDQPTWWETRYGPAPYTSDNLILWTDMENGYDYNDGNPVTITLFKRPGLLEIIPVDSQGNLKEPLNCVIGSYNPLTWNRSWIVGDDAPAEYSYRKSSTYPFDLMRIQALTKPALFYNLGADLDNYKYNAEFNQFLVNDRTHLVPSNIEIYGNGTAKTSYINWIVDYQKQLGVDATTKIKTLLSNLDVRLVNRLAGFSDKVMLKFFVEKGNPVSPNPSLLIPDESYQVLLYNNQPSDKITYSGVIIQKTEYGYTVYGNNQTSAYFSILEPVMNGARTSITVGDVTVSVPVNYGPNTIIVPYGTLFYSEQEVAQFLIAYGKRLESQGMKFEQTIDDVTINWVQMVNEFLYWTQSGWSVNSVVTLNPSADNLTIDKESLVVQPLTYAGRNFILNNNMYPIQNKDLNIFRDSTLFNVTPLNEGDALSYGQFDLSNIEHGIVFDNVTLFDDIIYNLVTGLKQDRIYVRGTKSAEWNGTVFASGFIINQDNIEQWAAGVKYAQGSIVLYKNKYFTALTTVQPNAKFIENEWKETNYNEIQKGLLPNSSTRSAESALYYNSDKANLEQDSDQLSFSLIGFRPRDYMASADLTDITQVNVYKNMIKDKGTLNAIKAFKGANLPQGSIDYDVYENWAILQGEYGGVLNNNFVQFLLSEKLLTGNPSIIGLSNGNNVDGAQQLVPIYSLINYGTDVTSSNILPLIADDSNTALPNAGYVNINDVKMSAYTYSNLSTAVGSNGLVVPIDNLYVNNYVWLANYNSNWQIFTPESIGQVIQVSANLNNTSTVTFKEDHNLNQYDIFAIVNFDTLVNGYYVVTAIRGPREVLINLVLPPQSRIITGQGTALNFLSHRVAQPNDIQNLPLLNNEFVKNTVWVDENSDGGWAVYRKSINYNYNKEFTREDSSRFGSAVAYSALSGYLISDDDLGKVYRYQYNALTHEYDTTQVLVNSASFGTKIAHAQNIYAVSQPTTTPSVFIYAINNINVNKDMIPYQQIVASDYSEDISQFGNSVALSGDTNWLFISDYNENNSIIQAGSFVIGQRYQITSLGTTNFTSIGAPSNTVGVIFAATGIGTGTGTATQVPRNNVQVFRKNNIIAFPGTFVTGQIYQITYVGNTDFTAIGADVNEVGVYFKATGSGTAGTPIPASLLIEGNTYTISDLGTVDWNSIGYVGIPVVGGVFIKNGVSVTNFGYAIQNGGAATQCDYDYVNTISLGSTTVDKFGYSLSTNYYGTMLFVGAPYQDFSSDIENWGRTYVYNRLVQNVIMNTAYDPVNPPIFTLSWNPNHEYEGSIVSKNGVVVDDVNYTIVGNELTYTGTYNIGDVLTVSGNDFVNIQILETEQTPRIGVGFGTSVDNNTHATEAVVGAPFELSSTNQEGAGFRFTNGGARFGVIIGNEIANVTSNSEILLNGFSVTIPTGNAQTAATAINNANIINVQAESNNGILVISVINQDIATAEQKLTLSVNDFPVIDVLNSGTVPTGYAIGVHTNIPVQGGHGTGMRVSYTCAGTNQVVTNVSIDNPGTGYQDGDLIYITGGNATFTVSVPNVLAELGIDVYTQTQVIECPHTAGPTQFGTVVKFNEYNSVAISAPVGTRFEQTLFDFTDDENLDNDTIFDNNATQFIDSYPHAGAVYTFDYLSNYNESLTNIGAYTYAQSVNATNEKYGSEPRYGDSIDWHDNNIIIGAPYFSPYAEDGQVVTYVNTTGGQDWVVYRQSNEIVNINKIQNIQLFSAETNNTLINLDYIDPLQGKLLGAVRQNIDVIADTDPANYNNAATNQGGIVWGDAQVGTIWFDTSNTRYINYHQNDNAYNAKYWGTLFPGSDVAVYSWIASPTEPSLYQGSGTVLNAANYTVQTTLNANNVITPVYYFWVRNSGIIFNKKGKTLADTNIESYISNPLQSGVSYLAPLASDAVAIYNCKPYINANDTVLNIGYGNGVQDNPAHQEYQLIRQDYAEDFLPGLPGTVDYLVPESLYNRLLESLSGVDDQGAVVPNPLLPINVQSGVLARPRQSFFHNRYLALKNYIQYANEIMALYPITEIREKAVNGFLQNSGTYYNTTLYWTYVNWWAVGYDNSTKATIQVNTYADLSAIESVTPTGTIVSVLQGQNASSEGETYIYEGNSVWVRIGLNNGTIQFSSSLYDYLDAGYGFGGTFFDTDSFDVYPSEETRWIVRALTEQIYTNDLLIHRNKSLILLFEYIQEETDETQNYLPWLNKTSLVDVSHTLRQLLPLQNYRSDNQEFLSGYINETKPYHVVIKEFLFNYTGGDEYPGTITDFDLPAEFNTTLNKFVSPQLGYIDNINSGTYPTGYSTGTFTNQPTSGGHGTGLTVDYACSGTDQTITNVAINNLGVGYIEGDVITITGGNASFTLTYALNEYQYQYASENSIWQTSEYKEWFNNYGTSVVGQPNYPISKLTVYMNSTSDFMIVDNVQGFPINGTIKIYDLTDTSTYELIGYSFVNRETNVLSGLSRGLNNTTATAHIPGSQIVMDLPPVILLNGGKGYSNPPKITAVIPNSYPQPREAAVFEAVMAGGVVTEISTINSGSGYVATPDIRIEPSLIFTFDSANVDITTNTIHVYAPELDTGDLVRYVAGEINVGGLQDDQWYYINVLGDIPTAIVAFYESYSDAMNDANRVNLFDKGLGTQSIEVGARAVAITTSTPVRENNITLRFDRTSYDTQIQDWAPNAFYASEFVGFYTESSASSLRLASAQPDIYNVPASAGDSIFPIQSISNDRQITWSSGPDEGIRLVSVIANNQIGLSFTSSVDDQYPTRSTVGFTVGMPIKFTTTGGNITANTTYYVAEIIDLEYFTISDTQNGAVKILTNTTPANMKCITGTITDTAVITTSYPGIRQATATTTTQYVISNLNLGTAPTGYLTSLTGIFTNQPTTGGTGTGLTVNYTCMTTNQPLTNVTINNLGAGYVDGDIITIRRTGNLSSGNATFTLRIINNLVTVDLSPIGTSGTSDLYTNIPVYFTGNVFGGIEENKVYYVVSVFNDTQFTLSEEKDPLSVEVLYTTAANQIVCRTAADMNIGDPVVFDNMVINDTAVDAFGNIQKATIYYVKTINYNVITISATITNSIPGAAFVTGVVDPSSTTGCYMTSQTSCKTLTTNNGSMNMMIGMPLSPGQVDGQQFTFYPTSEQFADISSITYGNLIQLDIIATLGFNTHESNTIVSGNQIAIDTDTTNLYTNIPFSVSTDVGGLLEINPVTLDPKIYYATNLENITVTVTNSTGSTLFFDGSSTGNVLTVSSIVSGSGNLYPGSVLTGTGIVDGTYIIEQTSKPLVNAGSFVPDNVYIIQTLGTTDWNSVAGTIGQTYNTGDQIVAVNAGSGTGSAYLTGREGTYIISTEITATLTDIKGTTGVLNLDTNYYTDMLFVGMPITFNGATFGGIVLGQTYYVRNIMDDTSFSISIIKNESAVVLTVDSGFLTGVGSPVMQVYLPAGEFIVGDTYDIRTLGLSTVLNAAISNTQTTIPLVNTTGFTTSGTVLIDNEQITYTGINGNQLTGCTRGANTTVATAHSSETNVLLYSSLTDFGLTPVSAVSLLTNTRYTIKTVGTTNWNAIAGTSDITYKIGDQIVAVNAGSGTGSAYTTQFTASGVGSGTGTATVILSTDANASVWEQQILEPATVDVSYTLGGYQVIINNGGIGFTLNNTITIAGNLLGGTTPNNDLTMSVSRINVGVPGEYVWSLPVESNGIITNLIATGTPNGTSEQYYLKLSEGNTSGDVFNVYSDPLFMQPVSGIDFPYVGFTSTTATAINATNSSITVANSSAFNIGDPVIFTGITSSTELVLGQIYYIYDKPSSTQVRLTDNPGGSLITFTNASASMTMTKAGSFMLLPQPFYFNPSIVKYNNRVWQCIVSNNDPTFVTGNWLLLDSDNRKLNALDRVKGYYKPTVNMPGNDLTQLFTGLTYPNATYKGNDFEVDKQFTLDTQLTSIPFSPTNISIPAVAFDGTNYLAPANLPNSAGIIADIEVSSDWLFAKMSNQTLSFTDLVHDGNVYVMTSTNNATPIFKSSNYQVWSTFGWMVPYGTLTRDIEFDKKRLNSSSLALNAITSNNNEYVAVGSNILVSDDLVYWYERQVLAATQEFYGVSYVEIETETTGFTGYIAVGANGINHGLIYVSTDGITWTNTTPLSSVNYYGVTYGLDTIVVVGKNGNIWTSTDGTSWALVTPVVTGTLKKVVFANNTFVIVGENGVCYTSTDAITWTAKVTGTTENLNNILYVALKNEWTIVGDNNTILQTNNITATTVVWKNTQVFSQPNPEYSIVGDPFLSGYGPEEMVPGIVSDNLTMIVSTRPGTTWPETEYAHVGYSVLSKEFAFSADYTYSFRNIAQTPSAISVYLLNTFGSLGTALYENINYTVDWVNNTITLTNIFVHNPIRIDVYETGNGDQLVESSTNESPINTNDTTGFDEIELSCSYVGSVYSGGGIVVPGTETVYVEATETLYNNIQCSNTSRFTLNSAIYFAGDIFTSVAANTPYYVKSINEKTNTITISATLNSGIADSTLTLSNATGSMDVIIQRGPGEVYTTPAVFHNGDKLILGYSNYIVSTSIIDNSITTFTTNNLIVGQEIVFSNTIFGGISPLTTYYIKEILSTSTFTISETYGGAVLPLISAQGLAIFITQDYAVVAAENGINAKVIFAKNYDQSVDYISYAFFDQTVPQYGFTLPQTQVFNGNGTVGPFSLDNYLGYDNATNAIVEVNGLRINPDQYVISFAGQSLTFDTLTPSISDVIAVTTYNDTQRQYLFTTSYDTATKQVAPISYINNSTSTVTVYTSIPHNFVNNDVVRIDGVIGSTQLNNQIFIVEYVNTTTFRIYKYVHGVPYSGSDPVTGVNEYLGGGYVWKYQTWMLENKIASSNDSTYITVSTDVNGLVADTPLYLTQDGVDIGQPLTAIPQLVAGQEYFIKEIDSIANKFSLSLTQGGNAITTLTTNTGYTLRVTQWEQSNVDRLWVTVNGTRVSSSNLRVNAANEVSILTEVLENDDVVITSMMPSATPNTETYIQIVTQDNQGMVYRANSETTTWNTEVMTEFSTVMTVRDIAKITTTTTQNSTAPNQVEGFYTIGLFANKNEIISIQVYNNNVDRQGYINQEYLSTYTSGLGPFLDIRAGIWVQAGDELTITVILGKLIYVNGEYMMLTNITDTNQVTVIRGALGSPILPYIPLNSTIYSLLNVNKMSQINYDDTWNKIPGVYNILEGDPLQIAEGSAPTFLRTVVL
jgi:hypothetical protein